MWMYIAMPSTKTVINVLCQNELPKLVFSICFSFFTLTRQIWNHVQKPGLIELWSWKQNHKKKRLIDPLQHRDDLSMCINLCSAPLPYQLTSHRSKPKASEIPVPKAQMNVPSVVELKGLNVEILAINDKKYKVCPVRETNRLREGDWVTMCHSTVCVRVCVSISVCDNVVVTFISDPSLKVVF